MRIGEPVRSCLTIEAAVVWEFTAELDAALRAAITGHKNLVYQCVPAWWATFPLFRQLPAPAVDGSPTVLLVPDQAGADASEVELRPVLPVHAVHGAPRATRLLEVGAVQALAVTPDALLRLVSQSGVDLASVPRLVLAWPEQHAVVGQSSQLDTILAEAIHAQRIVVTADVSSLGDLLERHARRAPVQRVGDRSGTPAQNVSYAITAHHRLMTSIRDALEILDPATAFVWDPLPGRDLGGHIRDPWVSVGATIDAAPVQLTVAADLPSAEALARLAEKAEEVLVLVRPAQLSYLQQMTERLRAFRVPAVTDGARDRTHRFREDVRQRIHDAGEHATLDADLMVLAPLFDEFDPAVVAAAIARGATTTSDVAAPPTDLPAWVRIRVSGGARDRIRTGDLVGALLNAVGVGKKQVGRIEILDGFSLIEVAAEAAPEARSGLDGLVVRGKTLSARFDRR